MDLHQEHLPHVTEESVFTDKYEIVRASTNPVIDIGVEGYVQLHPIYLIFMQFFAKIMPNIG